MCRAIRCGDDAPNQGVEVDFGGANRLAQRLDPDGGPGFAVLAEEFIGDEPARQETLHNFRDLGGVGDMVGDQETGSRVIIKKMVDSSNKYRLSRSLINNNY